MQVSSGVVRWEIEEKRLEAIRGMSPGESGLPIYTITPLMTKKEDHDDGKARNSRQNCDGGGFGGIRYHRMSLSRPRLSIYH